MYNNYAVKVNTANLSQTLKTMEEKWSATYPDLIYSSNFLDDQIKQMYEREETTMKLVQLFSSIAILVGCMVCSDSFRSWRYSALKRSVSEKYWVAVLPISFGYSEKSSRH